MSAQSPGGGGLERRVTLLVTNVTKLAGVYVAVENALGAKDALTYAVAALMIAGGQVFEEIVLGFLSRLFALPPEAPTSKTSQIPPDETARMDGE